MRNIEELTRESANGFNADPGIHLKIGTVSSRNNSARYLANIIRKNKLASLKIACIDFQSMQCIAKSLNDSYSLTDLKVGKIIKVGLLRRVGSILRDLIMYRIGFVLADRVLGFLYPIIIYTVADPVLERALVSLSQDEIDNVISSIDWYETVFISTVLEFVGVLAYSLARNERKLGKIFQNFMLIGLLDTFLVIVFSNNSLVGLIRIGISIIHNITMGWHETDSLRQCNKIIDRNQLLTDRLIEAAASKKILKITELLKKGVSPRSTSKKYKSTPYGYIRGLKENYPLQNYQEILTVFQKYDIDHESSGSRENASTSSSTAGIFAHHQTGPSSDRGTETGLINTHMITHTH